MMIFIRSEKEIASIHRSNQIVCETLQMLKQAAQPGVTTRSLDQLAEEYIVAAGGQPAFKGYHGYPASICASIDEEVVHGIPSGRILRDGEILSLDVGVRWNGYYGDAALTVPIGTISPEKARLLTITEEALYQGIAKAQPGARLSDISHAIQNHVEQNGFSVVRVLVGHGIGHDLHEPPEIPNYGLPGRGPQLRPGMCLAIEPMVNAGRYEVATLPDGWTVVTSDHQPSAHFEHTIVITENGPRILSSRDN